MIQTLKNRSIESFSAVKSHLAPNWKNRSVPAFAAPATELPRAKLSRLLGLSEQVYVRYEKHVSRLTVGRLIHLCEVLGAAPEEIIAPAAIHLWGETETKADLLLASIGKLRTFDARRFQLARPSRR
ncbi:hypothetical protein ACLJYM_28175 [Rhizobium giardinii]|uniref:hypothetical protein n=1 Tax=Rhizobium giardinii TaxID=56731 RepID=UPI0039DF4342